MYFYEWDMKQKIKIFKNNINRSNETIGEPRHSPQVMIEMNSNYGLCILKLLKFWNVQGSYVC